MTEFQLSSITICGGNMRQAWLAMLLVASLLAPVPAGAAIPSPANIDEAIGSPSGLNLLGDSVPLLNAIPPNFLRMEPPSAQFTQPADYLNDCMRDSHGKVFHFKAMPVPVYINSFPDKHFVASVVRGFQAWEDSSNGMVRFVQVDDAAQARIQVIWKHLGREQDATGCVLGAHTITKYQAHSKGSVALIGVSGVPVPVYVPHLGRKYTVPPQVIEVNLDLLMSKNPSVRYRLLQSVVTHELGHALGMMGHSTNVADMMYPITDEHSRLSQRDLNTLLKLYERKPDVAL
jgi:hypothetical protein